MSENIKIKGKKKNSTLKSLAITLATFLIIILVVDFMNSVFSKSNKYLINYGKIEKTSIRDVYIQKQENVIDIDLDKNIIPIVKENDRVSKGSSIAFYKDESYDQKVDAIKKIDDEILQKVSSYEGVDNLNTKVLDYKVLKELKSAKDTNSYTKIREINTNIEDILLEKILSYVDNPTFGKDIKKLLDDRENYSKSILKSDQNINSNISGIVSYKIDGLETNAFQDIRYDDIRNNIDNVNTINKFGVKVLNNFLAYLYFEVDSDLCKNIEIDTRVRLRILEKNSKEIIGKVVDIEETKSTKKIKLEIRDSIEDLIDVRKVNCEIVWWSYEGLKVPNESILYINEIPHVKVVKYTKEYNVPVKILKDNGRFSIIENYSVEELEKMKLEKLYSIKIYDEIILKNQK